MEGDKFDHAEVLVGASRKWFKNSLDELEKNGDLKSKGWYGIQGSSLLQQGPSSEAVLDTSTLSK
jgi:hypothetical protein